MNEKTKHGNERRRGNPWIAEKKEIPFATPWEPGDEVFIRVGASSVAKTKIASVIIVKQTDNTTVRYLTDYSSQQFDGSSFFKTPTEAFGK